MGTFCSKMFYLCNKIEMNIHRARVALFRHHLVPFYRENCEPQVSFNCRQKHPKASPVLLHILQLLIEELSSPIGEDGSGKIFQHNALEHPNLFKNHP